MRYGILIILIVVGAITFIASSVTAVEPRTHWAMMAVNLLFFLGITQAGIIFSVIMRISKAQWGRRYMRLGEIITLSFIPVAIILFLAVGIGGVDHLFYWANPEPSAHGASHGAHALSPWLNKTFFYWRIIVTNVVFYVVAFIYFKLGRAEEAAMSKSSEHIGADLPGITRGMEKTINVVAAFTAITFVIVNTNLAWDFGMMIWKHWESSIFPPFYWVGNLFAGGAFLFLMSFVFLKRAPGVAVCKNDLESISKVIIGFILLWVYLFWSQFVVIWYTNLPHRSLPVMRQMTGEYGPIFYLMFFALFIGPFIALLFRRMKVSAYALGSVSVLICLGMWVNRYLMVNSAFSETPMLGGGTGVMTSLAVLSATILSLALFRRIFPGVTLTTFIPPSKGH